MIQYLKVWGGGIYELDEFYEIADELGILIWQVNCTNIYGVEIIFFSGLHVCLLHVSGRPGYTCKC